MFLYQLDLTTALRPLLESDETLLFLQDAVGLYRGKDKIPTCQNGQAYLTSHRICYVDHDKPREHSVAINLKDVDRFDLQAGFLKSSPKIRIYPKRLRRPLDHGPSPLRSHSASPSLGGAPSDHGPSSSLPSTPRQGHGTWICAICSFANPIPSNFDPTTVNAHTPFPTCLACGVLPAVTDILKAAISQASGRNQSPRASITLQGSPSTSQVEIGGGGTPTEIDSIATLSRIPSSRTVTCPRCTFVNHPSLKACEICGAALPAATTIEDRFTALDISRSSSPGVFPAGSDATRTELFDCVKLSFRAGGDKTFHDRLKEAMVQRKWLLHGAPPVPKPGEQTWPTSSPGAQNAKNGFSQDRIDRTKTPGLAGLQQRDMMTRKNNEVVIGNAFEDLNALMASAKEIVALAEKFSGAIGSSSTGATSEATDVVSRSAAALGLVTTKDLLGSSGKSESLYISELSRNLAEFLTDDATGILRREGGIMSLVDLWAVFNRARGGVELISPLDFHKAASQWEKLNLPLRLRQFKSGLLVVQGKDRTDEKTTAALLAWLQTLREDPSPEALKQAWNVRLFGMGVTPQETAERFGWSVGVASEELEMAEERGALCREEGVEGLRFWENWLVERGSL
ncbi:MAG: hypothetical protein M1823_000086 [Watsoniomyces obsoletus]|nr:MAG: hypothetical protein M1823_000086 [Watsoniomyces obsoletus]